MKPILTIILVSISIFIIAGTVFAQTTSFSYQGRLDSNGAPANGPYLFQFKVRDANNIQFGPTITDLSTSVANGIFTVQLDFGDAPFNGSQRFLEIGVRQTVSMPYTVLSPNQLLRSAPY